VRAAARRRYHSSWIINYATMFEAGLVSFVVGSAFLNRAHFDLFYHWVALVICFGVIARREMDQELAGPAHVEGGRGELELVARPGFGQRVRTAALCWARAGGA
jgi:hypothetical protein